MQMSKGLYYLLWGFGIGLLFVIYGEGVAYFAVSNFGFLGGGMMQILDPLFILWIFYIGQWVDHAYSLIFLPLLHFVVGFPVGLMLASLFWRLRAASGRA